MLLCISCVHVKCGHHKDLLIAMASASVDSKQLTNFTGHRAADNSSPFSGLLMCQTREKKPQEGKLVDWQWERSQPPIFLSLPVFK